MDRRSKEEIAGALEESQACERALLVRIDALEEHVGRLAAELRDAKAALAFAGDQVRETAEKAGRAEGELDALQRAHLSQARDVVDLRRDRDSLKDQLHRMTIENARAQGWRERVEAFDPVGEQQERDMRRPRITGADFAGAMRGDQPAEEPWYRRA